MGTAKELAEATASYEAWIDRWTTTSPQARAEKHTLMASGPFPFLRATYYRWVTLVAELPPPPGPVVAAVGDVHVENYGTWRDAEARLAWGINDLDEADHLPAAFDLLRLATSVEVARADSRLTPGEGGVALLIAGYEAALRAGGASGVLERPDPPAIGPLVPRSHGPRWWARITALPAFADPPDPAIRLLRNAFPAGVGALDVRRRTAGLGSRDHLRLVAVADVFGAPAAREVKALAPPATWWAGGRPPGGRVGSVARMLLAAPHRAGDPSVRIRSGWSVRRVAPWADRIEIADLRARADVAALLRAMGGELAGLHLASAPATDLAAVAGKAGRRWLTLSTARMTEATLRDAALWRAGPGRSS